MIFIINTLIDNSHTMPPKIKILPLNKNDIVTVRKNIDNKIKPTLPKKISNKKPIVNKSKKAIKNDDMIDLDDLEENIIDVSTQEYSKVNPLKEFQEKTCYQYAQNKYFIYIFEKYKDLKNSGKQVFDNNDLWKIFEYYTCIKLSEEYKQIFYEYDDIDPDFKENNSMSRNDTGIDASNLIDTIVQCKLRNESLTWKEVSTFFGSQNIFDENLQRTVIRWNKLMIARNDDCKLASNLAHKHKMYDDKQFNKEELINFCEKLLVKPPKYPITQNSKFVLRDYQKECIKIIKTSNKNVVISLPTGSGKNICILHSIDNVSKYLILVPRIILMEQLRDEIIKHRPLLRNNIQLIGDSSNKFTKTKRITICVYNSIGLIEKHCNIFKKIFIDEAHHVERPEIYSMYDDDTDNASLSENDNNENTIEDCNEEIILKDDSEDELVNVDSYTKIIKSLIKYNNNIYMSATIDKIDKFEYYGKDIRYMIDQKFLCDYTIIGFP
jgi:hypothetical protein